MTSKVPALLVHDIADLGETISDVIETISCLDAQSVHLAAVNPAMESGTDTLQAMRAPASHLANIGGSGS